ncbi:hypothetical protein KJ953_02975, partial [Patescibacteria group bacterium]|nr:hypothetical protein [Patescibacteria group bacterium]
MIDLASMIQYVFSIVLGLSLFLMVFMGLGIILLQWLRFKNREEVSLNFVLLELAVPRDNEVKIDAAEQMFAALSSIKKGGFWQKFKSQQHLSFEVVGRKEDIRFYVSCHRDNMELVDKQLAGAYPGIQVKEVEEYNVFDNKGKVAFTELVLKNESFKPIKSYKDLSVDSLSAI